MNPQRGKTPIIVVTGFLGSGKTSLVREVLSHYAHQLRIAVVQNEFANSSIDGFILQEEDAPFVLKELNTGSIFCSCLFSHFKEVMVELSQRDPLDVVIVEATGIADPIGIAQLMEDSRVAECYYLSRIVAVVDAPRLLQVLSKIMGVRHQIQVADTVVVNKIDLVDSATLERVIGEVKAINPLTQIETASYARFELSTLLDTLEHPLVEREQITGALTKCGSGNYISKIFKTTQPIRRANLDTFIASLGDEVLRLKGFFTDEHGDSYMVQYVPNWVEIVPCTHKPMGKTELIAIGYSEPNFALLQANSFRWNG